MKNNIHIAYIGFGFLLGIWFSTLLLFYTTMDILVGISIFGGAICFLGFIHYWSKTNHLKTQIEDKTTDAEDKTLLKKKKPRTWKLGRE